MNVNAQFVAILILLFLFLVAFMFVTKGRENYTLRELVTLASPRVSKGRGCGSKACEAVQAQMREEPCCSKKFFNTPKTLGGMKCNCSPEALEIIESAQEGFRFNPTVSNERLPMTRPISVSASEDKSDSIALLNLNPVEGNSFQDFQLNKFTDCKTCNGSIYSVDNKTPLSYYSVDRSR